MYPGLFNVILFITLLSACSPRHSNERDQQADDSLKSESPKKEDKRQVEIKNSAVHELTSTFTKTAYDIYVSFPANYQTSGKKYPLLIVLDAEVNFGAATYIAQRLVKDELIPELIVVGIAYRGETEEDTYYSLRAKDFTPTSDKIYEHDHESKFKAGTGGAENFVKFLSSELMPYLLKNYPINDQDKSIYGHSFGGLFGTYLFHTHPEIFNNYLVLSPSLWWDHKKLLDDLKANSLATPKGKLYVGTGALENTMVDDHREMVDFLNRTGKNQLKIKSEILDHETHRTVFGRGFTNGLRFIYAKK